MGGRELSKVSRMVDYWAVETLTKARTRRITTVNTLCEICRVRKSLDLKDLPLSASSRDTIESCLALETPLSEVEFPFEAHLLCHYFNWDDDPSPIAFVMQHAECDLGTALMVYWEAGIEEFLDKDPKSLRPAGRRVYDIVMAAQTRLIRDDFQSRIISYTPQLNALARREYGKKLPQVVMQPSPGTAYHLY